MMPLSLPKPPLTTVIVTPPGAWWFSAVKLSMLASVLLTDTLMLPPYSPSEKRTLCSTCPKPDLIESTRLLAAISAPGPPACPELSVFAFPFVVTQPLAQVNGRVTMSIKGG